MRRGTSTLDAQLLNPLALRVEEIQLKLNREDGVFDVNNVPLNVDNRGSYYKVQIPDTYQFEASADGTLRPPNVRVFTAEQRWTIVHEYDDLLPVPAGVAIAGPGVKCYSLLVHDGEGNDYTYAFRPGKLNFPNNLYLKLDSFPQAANDVQVILEGYTEPLVVSLSGQPKTQEIVALWEENIVRTRYAWADIEKVTVRNLPKGARLRIAIAPAAFGAELDRYRPYHDPDFRGQPLERYWTIDGAFLKEKAFLNRVSGYEPIQSYLCIPELRAFALEPNTYGMFSLGGTKLYYSDRREPMPTNLAKAVTFTSRVTSAGTPPAPPKRNPREPRPQPLQLH